MKAPQHMKTAMVLTGEIEVQDGILRTRSVDVDWDLLAQTGLEVWLVFRAHELPYLLEQAGCRAAVDAFVSLCQSVTDSAISNGLRVRGVQLDYDCPTEKLGDYKKLLRQIQEQLPALALSITALPAWLGSPELAAVVQDLDHFVLQVHSLEEPSHIEDRIVLCDATRVADWAKRAALLQRPFYVSLPTYGYQLFFAQGGAFVGMSAEPPIGRVSSLLERFVLSDPVSISESVLELKTLQLNNWRGFAWFRLPVQGDRLNWSWPLLEQVLKGQAPVFEIEAEARCPSPNLYEVWVKNAGLHRPEGTVRLNVDWSGSTLQVFDAINGFEGKIASDKSNMSLTGRAPQPGEESMAAWLRISPVEGKPRAAVNAGKVEILR